MKILKIPSFRRVELIFRDCIEWTDDMNVLITITIYLKQKKVRLQSVQHRKIY